jgi:NAD(P)-dependent dehydrogenase (short-subunit alcohol dehydrogenase family)
MNNHPFSLSGKRILITGASSGIGRAIAVACSEMGADLIITGRSIDELQHTLSLMSGDGHQMIKADLTNESELEFLVDSITSVDGFVCNAGVNTRMLTHYIKQAEMDRIMQINLIAPILLTKKLLKNKKINNVASIVFISSIAVSHSSIGDGIYSATKGGLNSFSKVLALELAGKGIRVNTVQPGMIRTKMIENGPLSEADYAKDEKQYPIGRYGTPQEVAYAAVYLLSDQTKWMTGSDLVLDGGRSLI